MKNSYLIVGVIILIAILGFTFRSNKTEAPMEEKNDLATGVETTTSYVFVDGIYEIDKTASKIYWEGEKITGSKEKGAVMLQDGTLSVSGGMPASGEFLVDMNTITSDPNIDMLVKHLKGDDFFSVDTYPTSKFVLKTITPSSEEGGKEGRFVIAGDLTIKGITKPMSFTANVKSEGDMLYATASFAINRADWQIKYGSSSFFKDLGDKAIRDAVTIGLDLKAKKVIQ